MQPVPHMPHIMPHTIFSVDTFKYEAMKKQKETNIRLMTSRTTLSDNL